jgi:hypothetical protein
VADYDGRLAAADFEGRIAHIRAKLDSFPAAYLPIIDREDDGVLERLQLTLDHVLVVTGAATPQLIPERWIDDLAEDVDAIYAAIDHLEGLDENTITVPLVAALSSAIEETTKELMAWPLQPSTGDWRDAVTQAASTYRRSLGQQVTVVAGEISGLAEQLADLKSEVAATNDAHRQAVASRHDELEAALLEVRANINALESQQTSIQAQLTRSIERADQAISTQQQQFSEAQEQRGKDFRAALDDISSTTKMSLMASESEAETYVEALKAQVEESAELVSVFAAAGTANAFSKEAKDQSGVADTWRKTAVVFAVGTVLAAASLLFGSKAESPNWELVIGKLSVAIALGGVAAYAASQSGRHRRREEDARQLELTIAAFGPFVRDLDEARRIASREKVVDAIFTREIGGGRGPTPTGSTTLSEDQINIVSKLLEIFKR